MNNSSSIFNRPLIVFLLFFLLIGAVYSPVLYFNYLFHDDAFFWVKIKELGFKHYYYDIDISRCRYTSAFMYTLENFFIHRVSDLKILRFLGIVISSCSACLLFRQFRRLSLSDIQAFLITSATFFLPGFSDIIFNGSYSSILALCIYLACWSFHRINMGKGTVIPFFSFLFTISIYPPAAMFYWTMTGMFILFTDDRHSVSFRTQISRYMFVGLTGLLTFGVSVFFMHYFFAHKTISPLYNPYEINHDWLNKLQWFFREPMRNALNLWDIFPKLITSIAVSGFILLTLIIAVLKKSKQVRLQKRADVALSCIWQFFLFIFVIILSFLPNLAANENVAFYRCLIPLTSLIWIILVWAIFQWKNIIPTILTRWSLVALLSLVVVYAGIKTFHQVLYYRVLPSYVEYNAYKSMAQEIRLRKVDAIHIILPYHLSIERYDEFGSVSSHYVFDIYHMIYCVFKETNGQGQYPVPFLYVSYPDDHVLTEVKEIFILKLPNGKWAGKDINKGGPFRIIDHSTLGNTLDRELICTQSPYKKPSKRQNWYILNLNDLFSPHFFKSIENAKQ